MSSPVYTLGNPEFAFLVNRVAEVLDGINTNARELYKKSLTGARRPCEKQRAQEVLRENEIPYAFVGGVGVQAHILDRYSRVTGKDVSTLMDDEDFRAQDHLRATDSIDLAIKLPEYAGLRNLTTDQLKLSLLEAHTSAAKKINGICDSIVNGGDQGSGHYFTRNHVFSYETERDGIQRPIFGVSVDCNKKSSVSLVIHRRAEDLDCIETVFYNPIIQDSTTLTIPYSDTIDLSIRVAKPEHLLAVKIASDRPKDAMDVENLVQALREKGEFDLSRDFHKFSQSLKDCLMPQYESELRRFCDNVGIEDITESRKSVLVA